MFVSILQNNRDDSNLLTVKAKFIPLDLKLARTRYCIYTRLHLLYVILFSSTNPSKLLKSFLPRFCDTVGTHSCAEIRLFRKRRLLCSIPDLDS